MSTANIPNDLISANEAAKLLRVHGASIRRWIVGGAIPGFQVGSRWMLAREDVIAFVKPFNPKGKPRPLTVAELREREQRIDQNLREAGIRK
jgi:excisionase family DNA binding protein